jgi:hypothetical protein
MTAPQNSTATATSRTSPTTISTSTVPSAQPRRTTRRLSTETKAAYKTTEFWIYIAMVIGVLIASQVVGSDSNASATGSSTANVGDYFRANTAWLYITLLTLGYMISRGLSKAGSRDFYDDEADNHDGHNH